MTLIDTHCHIHETGYPLDSEAVYQRALDAGVKKMICVGTDETSSRQAVEFAATHEYAWASVGLHPHEAKKGEGALDRLAALIKAETAKRRSSKVVAVGECGLDYHYTNSPKEDQIKMLHGQLEIAQHHDLPVIFHVRDAFGDFWPVLAAYGNLRGVLHSFTSTREDLDKAAGRGLYIGVNGISTFTKAEAQKTMFRNIPLHKLLIETDAPFLTPVPKRGTVNEPAYVMSVAKHLASLYNTSPEDIARKTAHNAANLFTFS